MMQADEAHLLARFDISDRLMEPINSVVSIKRYAKTILPLQMYEVFEKKSQLMKDDVDKQRIDSMDLVEAKEALVRKSGKLRKAQQHIRRLRNDLDKKSPAVEFKNEGDAIKAVKDVFQYLSSLKNVDAMRTLLCTAMEELHKNIFSNLCVLEQNDTDRPR